MLRRRARYLHSSHSSLLPPSPVSNLHLHPHPQPRLTPQPTPDALMQMLPSGRKPSKANGPPCAKDGLQSGSGSLLHGRSESRRCVLCRMVLVQLLRSLLVGWLVWLCCGRGGWSFDLGLWAGVGRLKEGGGMGVPPSSTSRGPLSCLLVRGV